MCFVYLLHASKQYDFKSLSVVCVFLFARLAAIGHYIVHKAREACRRCLGMFDQQPFHTQHPKSILFCFILRDQMLRFIDGVELEDLPELEEAVAKLFFVQSLVQ